MLSVLLICDYSPYDEHVGSRRWSRFVQALELNDFQFIILSPSWGQVGDQHATILGKNKLINWPVHGLGIPGWQYRKRAPQVGKGGGKRASKGLGVFFPIKRLVVNAINAYYFPDVSWYLTRRAMDVGKELIDSDRPDVIIASHPFCGTLRVAKELSARFQLPWIADMRDGWSGYHLNGYRYSKKLSQRLKDLERRTLDSASAVISATDGVDESLNCSHDRRHVVYTGYNKISNHETIIEPRTDSSVLTLALAGSVTEMHDTHTFLKGLSSFVSGNPRKCTLNYYGNYFGFLQKEARKHGIPEDTILNKGFLKISDLIPNLACSDVLISLGMKGQNGKAYASARIFDYFAAERPILAASKFENEMSKMVSVIPGCFLCKEAEMVTQALVNLQLRKDSGIPLQLDEAALKAINRWTTQGQAAVLKSILEIHA